MERWALLSVRNKAGLIELAKWFLDQNVGLLASGGTYRYLSDQGVAVRAVEELTGFAEILGGRVKTLHPRIYAGILSRRTDADAEDCRQVGAPEVAAVVVDLYPFAERVEEGAPESDLIEEIDIGGVALIRAAAKNFAHVLVVVSPEQYGQVMAKPLDRWTREERRQWAQRAFLHTAAYDAAISRAFAEDSGLGDEFVMGGTRLGVLRYGENPHQPAAFYRLPGGAGFAGATLHQGKALSFNNYADADTAWGLVRQFSVPAAVAVKHQTPSGVGYGTGPEEAYRRAYEADPVSIFGGIVAFNVPVDEATAKRLQEVFLEVVVAPGFSPAAIDVLAAKRNLRVLSMPAADGQPFDVRTVAGGFLVQRRDWAEVPIEAFRLVAGPPVDWQQVRDDAYLAWRTVQYVKSNAIVLARDGRTVGIGGGQTNRIDAARQALERAGALAEGAVLASDAFFPFGDVMAEAVAHKVRVVIQPGGSVRDQESIDLADRHNVSLLFTGERHFRH